MMLDYFKDQDEVVPAITKEDVKLMTAELKRAGLVTSHLKALVGDKRFTYQIYKGNDEKAICKTVTTYKSSLMGKTVAEYLGKGFYFDGYGIGHQIPIFRKH